MHKKMLRLDAIALKNPLVCTKFGMLATESFSFFSRTGNSLIGFPSELLVFCEQPKRFARDRSFPLSDLSNSLMVAQFW